MKLLLLDTENTSTTIKALEAEGFQVDTALTMDDGLKLFQTNAYDIILNNTALAAPLGFPLLRRISETGRSTLCLAMSERDAVDQRVKALEIAADAVLIKPYSMPELIAMIRSLIRRGPGRKLDVYKVADLDVDVIRHMANRAGKKLELTPKEFALLSFLIRRSGETVTRAQISEHVWDMQHDFDTNIVDVHIRRLRSKVDDPFQIKLIQTVRGVGYTLKQPA